jgi:hypothetical protein
MADTVAGQISGAVPDVQQSALRLHEEIRNHYLGTAIAPALIDMMTLTHNLASIIAPLYSDIHATFANPDLAVVHNPQLKPREA